ncbi:ribokinase [Marinococcus luteus]|uniref:Ribokinase n=1 Tax=Marinococcus luteus TaxID=1122204 RepID=A0A1H2UB20_9BACI|nr:ribokinase [Marinococcus luteus]SDW53392.1 ribokinase [Marinococcus luteus]
MPANIVVVGSINMDLVTTAKRMPSRGETILGEGFHTYFGGKGANQAVAAARLGARVSMVGAVGSDAFGTEYLEHLGTEGINTEHVRTRSGVASGVATIIVSEGDNCIIVTPGANATLSSGDIEKSRSLLREADVVLVQLEIPAPAVEKVLQTAEEEQTPVILNPAPMQPLSPAYWDKAAYLTPNEKEFERLQEEWPSIAGHRENVVVTKGAAGVSILRADGRESVIPVRTADVRDTTGAGDTFNGAFATAVAEGMPLEDACWFANAASAISVEKEGAQTGMPVRAQIEGWDL